MPGRRSQKRTKPRSERPGPALAPTRPGADNAGYETTASHIAACGLLDDDGRRYRAGLADAACRAAARKSASGGEKGSAQTKGSDGCEKARGDADAGGAAQARGYDQTRGSTDALPLADTDLR